MSSGERYFGLHLAVWYGTLFVLGCVGLAVLAYQLTAASLVQRDRQIIEAKLGEYAAVYRRGGVRALANAVSAEQLTAPERLYVRIVDRGAEAVVLSTPQGWNTADLESVSVRLGDGTLVQVGKSAELRRDLLARVRLALSVMTLSLIAIGLTGGWLATRSALQPIRRLTAVVRRIVRTGRTDERVTVAQQDDAIRELTVLFNAMLDRIEALVGGMRGALDAVSHDMRTPLTRLRGTAEMALSSAPDVERYREALADCVEEADRVLVMLNTLMDISEAESGAMPLQRETVSLGQVAARAVELYRDVADAKGVELSVARGVETDGTPPLDSRAASSCDPQVPGDRVRLEQVVANLVDNAVKYTPPGGRVVVGLAQEPGWARIDVRDTGVGIPADELPRIWDRLFRGDASRTERGLGLGLSLVRAIVRAHGGRVDVTSEPGLGSTFTVMLPAQ